MTSTKSKSKPSITPKPGVRAPYTLEKLKYDLQHSHAQNSLRTIAAKYGVSHAAVQRVLDGHEPKRPGIRRAFGLPEYVPAPVCPTHGIVHLSKRCPRKPRPKPNPPYEWGEAMAWVLAASSTNVSFTQTPP